MGGEGEDAAIALEEIDGALRTSKQGAQGTGGGCGQTTEQGFLIGRGAEDRGVGEQADDRGFVADQAFEGGEEESAVAADGSAKIGAELFAARGWLDAGEGIAFEHAGEGVAGIERLITEIAEEPAVQLIGAGAGNDVDDTAGGAAKLGGIVAAVDLEFLDRVLADILADAAGGIVHLAAIHRDGVATAVGTIEGETAMGSLLHAEIGIVGERGGIHDAGRQQSVGRDSRGG